MTRPDEEARAAAYRADARERQAAERARARGLAGDTAAAVALKEAWEPVRLWLKERRWR